MSGNRKTGEGSMKEVGQETKDKTPGDVALELRESDEAMAEPEPGHIQDCGGPSPETKKKKKAEAAEEAETDEALAPSAGTDVTLASRVASTSSSSSSLVASQRLQRPRSLALPTSTRASNTPPTEPVSLPKAESNDDLPISADSAEQTPADDKGQDPDQNPDKDPDPDQDPDQGQDLEQDPDQDQDPDSDQEPDQYQDEEGTVQRFWRYSEKDQDKDPDKEPDQDEESHQEGTVQHFWSGQTP